MDPRAKELLEFVGFIVSLCISLAGFVFLTTYLISVVAAGFAAFFLALLSKTHPELIKSTAKKIRENERD